MVLSVATRSDDHRFTVSEMPHELKQSRLALNHRWGSCVSHFVRNPLDELAHFCIPVI